MGEVNKNVYIVISCHESYEDYHERIEAVFGKKEDAEKFAEEFDSEHIIDILYDIDDPEEKARVVYNIVPEDVYINWPYDEEKENIVEEYMGYTADQFDAQYNRVGLLYDDYGKCCIEEHEVK